MKLVSVDRALKELQNDILISLGCTLVQMLKVPVLAL